MDFNYVEAIRKLLLFAPPFIISLTFHEFAHAWVANRLGDSTARYLGRLTVDPMAHISMLGTVIFPAIAVLTGAPLFGWANPVPVDSRNFKKPRAYMAAVAFSGPLSNLFLATLSTAILSGLVHYGNLLPTLSSQDNGGMAGAAVQMLVMAVQLNLFLACFNLLPIPPLDGGHILSFIVGPKYAHKVENFGHQGQWLLLILFFTGALRYLAGPVIELMGFLFRLFGIPFA